MNKINFSSALLFLLLYQISNTASAAVTSVVYSVNGDVRATQGERYAEARPGQILYTGDRIMVMRNSSATLRFANGCDILISGGSIAIIPEETPCHGGVMYKTSIANQEAVNGVNSGTWIAIGAGALLLGALGGGSDSVSVSP